MRPLPGISVRPRIVLMFILSAAGGVAPRLQAQWQGAAGIQERDPCGYPVVTDEYLRKAADQWGYGYDSLQADLQRWQLSPFVTVDSVGSSVQGRTLFMLSITDTTPGSSARKRVWIHARTHPGEVQGTWVTNAMIEYLLSDTPLARRFRDSCVFNIMPMYNPDGVELGYPRENAHGIDIESNWSTLPGEPEVQVLRGLLTVLMWEANPIRVALNVHSAYACTRYFVYHDASGTTESYATLEKQFIGFVSEPFTGWFQPWTYFISWVGTTPTYYPESWFWYNHGESVLALTYEDMNCPAAHGFDTTALAILRGVGRFLGVVGDLDAAEHQWVAEQNWRLLPNYPNPFNPRTTIRFDAPSTGMVSLKVYDLLGREIRTLLEGEVVAGQHLVPFDAAGLASGTYIYRLHGDGFSQSKAMLLVR